MKSACAGHLARYGRFDLAIQARDTGESHRGRIALDSSLVS